MYINTLWEFNAIINDPSRKYAWPGGYPCYFICHDGEALSWDAAVENAGLIRDAIIANDKSGWHVVALDINWEDTELYCSHTNNKIESAYGDSDD